MFVHAALRATRDNQGTPGAIAGRERNRASLHRALGGYRFVTRRNAVSIDWDATCADTRSRPSGDNLPQNACSPKNRCRETSHKPPRGSFSKGKNPQQRLIRNQQVRGSIPRVGSMSSAGYTKAVLARRVPCKPGVRVPPCFAGRLEEAQVFAFRDDRQGWFATLRLVLRFLTHSFIITSTN